MVVGRSLSGGVIQGPRQREQNVGSPPSNASSPLVVAETITTRTEVITTTTTQTTTRFFSLPRWRKRSVLSSPDVSNPGSNSLQDGRSLHSPILEKPLPPTPEPSQVRSTDYGERSASGKSAVHHPDAELSSRGSTSALARATLGLSLPLATPQASSKINTIPFASNPSLTSSTSTSSSIRRAKSYARCEPTSAPPLRRARGLSFGTTGFLNLGEAESVKGNEVLSDNTRPIALSRKTSFWNRRKSFHSVEHQSSFNPQEASPLPLLPVSSPPERNTVLRNPPAKLSALGVLRNRSTTELETSVDASFPKTKKRPQTADIARPQATRSLYFNSPRLPSPEATKSQPPLRPRIHTNPPLLHRLSLVFSPSETLSATSAEKLPDSTRLSPARKPLIPKPREDEESPSIYLGRLLSTISKAEVAGILASSPDPFYVKALQTYIDQFNFFNDPLDVALRKLLMEVGLPRETQQIDRVIEAFAVRYRRCNADLFISEDHPYILAFSLIMLHTDAFNKSNKRKMSKADYIKNTRLPGVPPEVLDCFYDNIVFAPFIFIEDPLDINGQRGLTTDSTTNRASLAMHTNTMGSIPSSRGSKIDLYYLISNDLLEPLRIDLDKYIPIKNPYSFEGTAGPWDADELQRAFARANVIEVGTSDATWTTSIFQSNSNDSVGSTSFCDSSEAPLDVTHPPNDVWTLRVTKVGFLNRKDDTVKGGKKSSNRKWRSWSVILTGSQLLFFRDPSWATQSDISNGQVIFPESTVLKPDELLSVRDAIAVFDKSYSKYDNTFRFVMPDGRQILLQASDEQELNAWISRINYASAFKSAGIRMRPLGMSGKDIELTGVAAATSHLHDQQQKSSGVHTWDSDAPHDLMDMLSGNPPGLGLPSVMRRVTMNFRNNVDFDLPCAPDLEGADQFRATFDRIKAKLDSGSLETSEDESTQVESRSSQTSSGFVGTDISRLPSRSQIIRSKLHDLQSRIDAATTQVTSDLRIARNIATLTPFRKTTKDKLLASVQIIAQRITLMRLDIMKLTCQRDVLSDDLYSEGRALNHVKKVAFKAAKETLQSQPFNHIPRITSSPHRESDSPKCYPDSLVPISTGLQREDSICGSFHSAVEFGTEWPSSDDLSSSNFVNTLIIPDSRRPSTSRSSTRHLPVANIIPSRSNASSSDSSKENFEEEAEAWNETRCAQRVSLVRVPSDIRMLAKYQH